MKQRRLILCCGPGRGRSCGRSIPAAAALLVGAGVVLLIAPEAMAQFGEVTKSPPTPSSSDKPPLLIQYGVLVILILGVLGLSILRSKREVRN